MKVIKFLFLSSFIFLICFLNLDKVVLSKEKNDAKVLDYNLLSDNVVRFHFKANSDSEFDQYVKNTLKDEVMNYFNEELDLTHDKNENLNILRLHVNEIKDIAKGVLNRFGLDQEINIQIGRNHFNDRQYGEYVVPEGDYDYFILNIGQASGRNFWSLLFSNIGFIKSDDKKIDSMLSLVKENQDRNTTVFKSNDKAKNNKKENQGVKISFKIFEVVKDLIDKIF